MTRPAWISLLSGMLALAGASCSGGDGGPTEPLGTAEEDLATWRLSNRFGVSDNFLMHVGPGVPPEPAQVVFDHLKTHGLRHVRFAAPLSGNRGPAWLPAAVAGAQAEGVDLMVTLYLGGCTDGPQSGCFDITDESLPIDAAAAAFKVHFQAVWDVANPNGQRNVTVWGINEPDLTLHRSDSAQRAAAFYQAAREALDADGCPECVVVAGEVAHYHQAWVQSYLGELKARGQSPSLFSLHPYDDVDAASSQGNWRAHRPASTLGYTQDVENAFPGSHIWLTEVGRRLHRYESDHHFCVSAQCEWEAGIYVRDVLANERHVTRVYWYEVAAGPPSDRWDSALADREGHMRASYYGLLGLGLSAAEAHAGANHAHAHPFL